MDNPLGIEPVAELLRKYAAPSIVAMLVGALYNIVDQFFIGQRIGELGNAATNVTFPFSTLCLAIGLLFGMGGASIFNLTLGEGDKKKAIYYTGNAVVMLFLSGVILTIATQIYLTPLLKFFGSPDNVLEYAKTYARITSLGFPFLILTIGGGHLVRADGSPGYTMFFNLSGAIVNAILDPIFIFGLDMGMAGAAWATVIGQLLSFSLAVHYFCHFKTLPMTRKHLIPQWKYIKRNISLGAAPSLNQMAMMIIQVVMNKSLVYYGSLTIYGESVPLAVSGIVNKVAMVFFSSVIGISQGMQPISSFNYGAKQYDRVKSVYLIALRAGLVISTTAFLMFQFIPGQIISLFGAGSKIYFEFAISYFRIFMFFTFINCVQPISSNLFTSIGKPVKGIFLSLTRQTLLLLPFIVIFPLFMGIRGIMYAGPVADLMAAIISGTLVIIEFRQMGG